MNVCIRISTRAFLWISARPTCSGNFSKSKVWGSGDGIEHERNHAHTRHGIRIRDEPSYLWIDHRFSGAKIPRQGFLEPNPYIRNHGGCGWTLWGPCSTWFCLTSHWRSFRNHQAMDKLESTQKGPTISPIFGAKIPFPSHSHPITILYSPPWSAFLLYFCWRTTVFFGETKTSGTNCTHDPEFSRFLLIHQSRNMKKNMAKPMLRFH